MTSNQPEIRTVIVERHLAHKPAKVWRALTQPHLIREWLMGNDFELVLGRPFTFSEDWGSVECRVTAIEPNKSIAYSWDAFGLESMVTWTLTETQTGTHLRLEQVGFRPDQDYAFQGAQQAWPHYFDQMEEVLAKLD